MYWKIPWKNQKIKWRWRGKYLLAAEVWWMSSKIIRRNGPIGKMCLFWWGFTDWLETFWCHQNQGIFFFYLFNCQCFVVHKREIIHNVHKFGLQQLFIFLSNETLHFTEEKKMTWILFVYQIKIYLTEWRRLVLPAPWCPIVNNRTFLMAVDPDSTISPI